MTSRIMEIYFTVNPEIVTESFMGSRIPVKEILETVRSRMGFHGGAYSNDVDLYTDGSYSVSFGIAPVGVGWFKMSPEDFAEYMLPQRIRRSHGLENVSFSLLASSFSPDSDAVAQHFHVSDSSWNPAERKTVDRSQVKKSVSARSEGNV